MVQLREIMTYKQEHGSVTEQKLSNQKHKKHNPCVATNERMQTLIRPECTQVELKSIDICDMAL